MSSLLETLGGILALGNIPFGLARGKTVVTDEFLLQKAASLLLVDDVTLSQVLCGSSSTVNEVNALRRLSLSFASLAYVA